MSNIANNESSYHGISTVGMSELLLQASPTTSPEVTLVTASHRDIVTPPPTRGESDVLPVVIMETVDSIPPVITIETTPTGTWWYLV